MKKQLIRAAAATVLGLSLTAGFASADSISGNNNNATNKIHSTSHNSSHVRNRNNVGVLNVNAQGASSGDATVQDAAVGGNATSGNASNGSSTGTSVSASNSGGSSLSSGFWSNGGDNSISGNNNNSTNTISTHSTNSSTVHNTNNVGVANLNFQGAESGDATVQDVAVGGNATSGSAFNSSTTSTSVNVSN